MTKIRPVGGKGRVLVRRDPDPEATRAGVVIPIVCRKKDTLGTVLEVFGNRARQPLVRKGDRVLFSRYAGTDVNWNGETVTIMPEDELLAVLEDGP
jgi:chaperonin GroES